MGRVALTLLLFFSYFIFSFDTESNKVKEHVYAFLSDKSVIVLCWAVTLIRPILLSIIEVKFINLIFVYNGTYK